MVTTAVEEETDFLTAAVFLPRPSQCRQVKITILGDEGVPVQVDGEAWIQPPGIVKIVHKNRAQMLTRDRVRSSTSARGGRTNTSLRSLLLALFLFQAFCVHSLCTLAEHICAVLFPWFPSLSAAQRGVFILLNVALIL